MMQFNITDDVRPWLIVQRGGEAQFAHDQKRWQHEFETTLGQTLMNMQPYFPTKCDNYLDLGSGLGAIDMLIRNHYDGSVPKKEQGTYSNRAAALAFWRANGFRAPHYLTPDEARKRVNELPIFDLVISVGSWCFHYAPGVFLDLVKQTTKPGSVIITDVRTRQTAWANVLAKEFKLIAEIPVPLAKYHKAVYHVT